MNKARLRSAALLLTTFAMLGGCRRVDQEQSSEQPMQGPSPSPSAKAPPNAPSSGEIRGDGEVATILAAADKGEIAQGKLAQSKAQNPAVREFAQMMVDQHQQLLRRGDEILARLQIAPAESGTSRELQRAGDQTLALLKTATGEAFDRAYMTAQVQQHEALARMIDDKLRPRVQHPELRSHLETVRSAVARHLEEARNLRSRVASR